MIPGKKTKIQITVLAEVRYTIGSTSELESKERGPFHISIPKLTKSDMYKLFIYILLTNGFSILSTQTIEEVGAKIITHKKSFFKDHKMGRLKLESFFLDSRKKLKVRDDYYGGPQRQYTNIYYITAFYILVHKHIHWLCEYIYQYNKIYTSTTICIPVQKC